MELTRSRGHLAVPLVWWSRMVGFSCHGGGVLELYRGQHAEAAVAALSVVEDLQVLKDLIRQLDPGPPAAAVQQLHLHPRPAFLIDLDSIDLPAVRVALGWTNCELLALASDYLSDAP
jgi:hypothetical protein